MKNIDLLKAESKWFQNFCTAEICEPLSTLNRLEEFFELFLRDGLNSEFAYLFGLRDG